MAKAKIDTEKLRVYFHTLRKDDIIFFADEAGSWQVGVDWDAVLPEWLKCLAETSSPEAFAEEAVATINDFDSYDLDKHMKEARRVASPAQRKVLTSRLGQGTKR